MKIPSRCSVSLRLPEPIKQAIERQAQDERRSMAGQIEKILADALTQSGRLPAAQSRAA